MLEKEIIHTRIASISSLDGGIRLGWREALPPTVVETFDQLFGSTLAPACDWDAEPAKYISRYFFIRITAVTNFLESYNSNGFNFHYIKKKIEKK